MEKSLYSLDKNVLQERISRLEKLIDKETDPIALRKTDFMCRKS